MTNEKIESLLKLIREKAALATHHEEDPEYSPSSYENHAEDAFYSGTSDGEIYFARELLRLIEN